jgi:hypothetical protein
MKIKLVLIIASMAISCKSFSQFNSSQMLSSDGNTEWKFYDITMDTVYSSSFFYDSAYTTKDSYGYIKTWGREERLYSPKIGVKDTKSCVVETLYIIDCSVKTIKPIEIITRNLADNSIIKDKLISDYKQYWYNVAPGTIIEELVNKVCNMYP